MVVEDEFALIGPPTLNDSGHPSLSPNLLIKRTLGTDEAPYDSG